MDVIVAFVGTHSQTGTHISATPSLIDQGQFPAPAVQLESLVSENLWITIRKENLRTRMSCKSTFIHGSAATAWRFF